MMGHYRSEMGFDDEGDAGRQERERRALVRAIQKRIDRGDLADLIADLVYNFKYPEPLRSSIMFDAK
jgi:hypothetical protein